MKNKLNNKEFKRRAILVHGDKYDYSLVEYSGIYNKVKIVCSIHDVFEQTPKHHLNGKGCRFCAGNVKHTTESFIKKSKEIHGEIFDYSKVIYTKAHETVILICEEHGDFTIDPSHHLRGLGCKYCKNNKPYKNIRNKYNLNFVEHAKNLHKDKYDYSFVKYVNAKTKVKIRCIEHNFVFEQQPSNHIQGYGCPICGGCLKSNKENFIQKSIELNKDKYDYSLVEYINAKTKVKIMCIKHKYIFEQTPNGHISKSSGCPICCYSKGESTIKTFLDKNNIKYEVQKIFNGCIFENSLKYDFFIPSYNICIEFDGKQHFKPITHFGGIISFNKQLKKDKIKNEYCKNNNIHLIRIKYNDNIEDKLNYLLNFND